MEDLTRLRKFYELKRVERACSVSHRKESSAEHSWSSLMLADYFLSKMNDVKINRLHVYELLMYHDLVEIEAGDVCISKEELRKHKKELEIKALHSLKEKIPPILKQKFVNLFLEFECGETVEGRFAKAIDALDAEIHELDYKEDWKGWTEEFLRKKKEPLFEGFPLLLEMFEESIAFCLKNGYFEEN